MLFRSSTPAKLRSRVVSIYMLNTGLSPIGSVVAGIVAETAGAPTSMFAVGVSTVVFALLLGALAHPLRRWTPADVAVN